MVQPSFSRASSSNTAPMTLAGAAPSPRRLMLLARASTLSPNGPNREVRFGRLGRAPSDRVQALNQGAKSHPWARPSGALETKIC